MSFELLFLLVAVCSALSIVYGTVKVGISPMPSSNKAYKAMVELIGSVDAGSSAIVDLGSGWGNFVIPIAKRYPQKQIVGYELSMLPWIASVLFKYILGLDNLTLYRKDFLKADFSDVSVLVCYLYPGAMKKIEIKLLADKPAVKYLISNNFALPGWTASETLKLSDFYNSPIYLYEIYVDQLGQDH